MMVDKIIQDGSLRSKGDGFSVTVRLPWYRSLPLSTVEVSALSVDGNPVQLEQIEFVVNGRARRLPELRALEEEFWFVIDDADLLVKNVPLEHGSQHDVEVVLSIYPPYIKGLQRMVRWSKRLQVQ